MHLSPNEDTLCRLTDWGLISPDRVIRLHLGCGESHLDGYINIDFDSTAHSVQKLVGADVYGDVTKLNFPPCTVDQIRLHHVFEHFDRPTALGLLCRWHNFLKVGGNLVIETPDLAQSLRLLQSDTLSYQQKQAVIRHLFGSHEASWAVHWDGWYAEKYQHILSHLGFHLLAVHPTQPQLIPNVTVIAEKKHEVPTEDLKQVGRAILRESCVDDSPGEQRLWEVWSRAFEQVIDHGVEGSRTDTVCPAERDYSARV